MRKIVAIGFTVSIVMYTLLHYFTYIYPSEIGESILSVTGLLALVCAAVYLPIRSFLVPIFLLVVATIIQLVSGGSIIPYLMEGILQMRSLIALLFIVPVIGWILREEDYIGAIMHVAHRFLNTSKKFYVGIMFVNQIIAYFLLFGAIPMMYQFVNDFLRNKTTEAWEYFKGTALLRSFALTTLWVISIPSFAFAVDQLDASLGWTIVQGFFISLGGILLSLPFESYQEKNYQINITKGIKEEIRTLMQQSNDRKKVHRHVLEFSCLFVTLFSTIFIVHITLGWGLLLIIPPIIMLWTSAYFLLKKRTYKLVEQMKQYITKEVKHKSQQFSLMLSASMLIYAVNQSGLGNYLVDGLFYIENTVPFVNFLMILPFTAILLGFLGLGPLTVIVLVAGILQHVQLVYPPELVVLSMTSGSVIAVLLSPVILPIIVLSASNGLSILKNGFKFNLLYALTFYLFVQVYLQVVWYIVS
ncbi:hypothetical protein [Aquibacillus sediminis]|uniref:hypothetical protein n=1 Tax=Aquibacillus sediminis TaxID=2574734 RepID=UPI001FEBAC28|nr:hypothetical protein [Aquibacillus sediminis]